jgi:hypothetical protein
MNRWPSAVTINLWPYALRFVNDTHNSTPAVKTGRSPLEDFSGTPVRPQVLNLHPPFCPVYVLHNGLQGGGKCPNKWVRRSRVAIYLGLSPQHARSDALVLSLTTGYVSPQFHLKFDNFFETVQESKSLPLSDWQRLSCFTGSGKIVPPKKRELHQGDDRSPIATSKPPRIQVQFDLTQQDDAVGGDLDQEEGDRELPSLPTNPQPNEILPDDPPDEPIDPVRHHHSASTRRSSHRPRPPRCLIESTYAVLDDTDTVEDYIVQPTV